MKSTLQGWGYYGVSQNTLSLLREKRAFLLSAIVLPLATIPCCLADSCLDKKAITKQKEPNSDTERGICSPFFQCHNCNGFAFSNPAPKVVSFFSPETKVYQVYRQHSLSRFATVIWQPPKIN
ncbi:MAG: hypothetical protein JWQ14_2548 [Adhaeribacter sp.]|jgi:hypothetical protein|nr:hypothetical protein [Adhaeribacter sp.]